MSAVKTQTFRELKQGMVAIMLRDLSSIEIQGANFLVPTKINIFDDSQAKLSKITILYGRNGSGKSTIARAFKKVSGKEAVTVASANLLDKKENNITLTESEQVSVFVFDEDFVTENVRIEGDALGSIVMLGEQVDLTEKINATQKELVVAEGDVISAHSNLSKYKNPTNPEAPGFYIKKMKMALSQGDDCWAERDKKIKDNIIRTGVNDNTYKNFTNTVPACSRSDLIISFTEIFKELEAARSGTSVINDAVPAVPETYKNYPVTKANDLLALRVEKPALSEREKYLLSLVTSGQSEILKDRIEHLTDNNTTFCPYCLQDLNPVYKADLISKIQKVLTDTVKEHQEKLKALVVDELVLDLSSFAMLPLYQVCQDILKRVNEVIQHNNLLLQKKITDPYSAVTTDVYNIDTLIKQLETALIQLNDERLEYNQKVVDTRPLKERLFQINDQIAACDIKDDYALFKSQDVLLKIAQAGYDKSLAAKAGLLQKLDTLNAQRKRIDIAIEIINNGLKYIFFKDGRLSIERDGISYKLLSNGKPVMPKYVSVGERNIIGLCYFFAKILQDKNCESAYANEHLIILDDPVSSYDFENMIGILSFLKYKLSQFICGNIDTRVLIMTHDLPTVFNLEKICKELMKEWERAFCPQNAKFDLVELRDAKVCRFSYRSRHEYTELINLIYDYGCGNSGNNESDIVVGNMMRQALEAFATFVYKKGIEDVTTDERILNSSGMCIEHKTYFKNLMFRLVLNNGSHREEQSKSLDVDFFSVISEVEKRRTAKDLICFIFLLNKEHLLAHLGLDASKERIISGWCEDLKQKAPTTV